MASIDLRITVHFNDGGKLAFAFQPGRDPNMASSTLLEAANRNMFFIEAEGRLYAIPYANVRMIEISPAPEKIQHAAITGARVIE